MASSMDNNNKGAWTWNRKQETDGTLHSDPIDGDRTGTKGNVRQDGGIKSTAAHFVHLLMSDICALFAGESSAHVLRFPCIYLCR